MPVNTILGLFAKSPIKPLGKHSDKVHECCLQLVPFFEATARNDWEQANKIREEISQLEKQMRQAAADLNFEQAAELRDKMIELKKNLADAEK